MKLYEALVRTLNVNFSYALRAKIDCSAARIVSNVAPPLSIYTFHKNLTMASSTGMVDPKIFENLQTKIDEDAEVRDQIRAILQTLERQGRTAQSVLSRAHSTPAAQRKISLHLLRLPANSSSSTCPPICRRSNRWRDLQHQPAGGDDLQVTILQVCPSLHLFEPADRTDTMACGPETFKMSSSKSSSADG